MKHTERGFDELIAIKGNDLNAVLAQGVTVIAKLNTIRDARQRAGQPGTGAPAKGRPANTKPEAEKAAPLCKDCQEPMQLITGNRKDDGRAFSAWKCEGCGKWGKKVS